MARCIREDMEFDPVGIVQPSRIQAKIVDRIEADKGRDRDEGFIAVSIRERLPHGFARSPLGEQALMDRDLDSHATGEGADGGDELRRLAEAAIALHLRNVFVDSFEGVGRFEGESKASLVRGFPALDERLSAPVLMCVKT